MARLRRAIRHPYERRERRDHERPQSDLEGPGVPDPLREQTARDDAEGDTDRQGCTNEARRSASVCLSTSLECERLPGDEDACGARPMNQPSHEKERAWVLGRDPKGVEGHDEDLQSQARDEGAPSANAVGEDADERVGHDARRAVGRKNDPDERQRQTRPLAHQGQNGERNAPRKAREQHARGNGKRGAGSNSRSWSCAASVSTVASYSTPGHRDEPTCGCRLR